VLDLGDIPQGVREKIQIFYYISDSTNGWQTWQRPRGATMAMFITISGGAGGGGGCSGIAGSARGGGGGGNGGNIGRSVVPLFLLPDVLYIQVGAPGLGGAADTDGNSGTMSGVCVVPTFDTNYANLISVSAGGGSFPGSPAAGGRKGTATAGGLAGGGGSTATGTNMRRATIGILQGNNQTAGGTGGAHTGAVGGNVPFTGTPGGLWYPCGGGGGAGTQSADFAGGGYATQNGYLEEFKPPAPAAGSNDGSPGTFTLRPFLMYGGCGGSSSNTGVGGNGGRATIGAGGGGGGGGTTGGRGGDGGEGMVIIQCW
jgi:hypothetical protein